MVKTDDGPIHLRERRRSAAAWSAEHVLGVISEPGWTCAIVYVKVRVLSMRVYYPGRVKLQQAVGPRRAVLHDVEVVVDHDAAARQSVCFADLLRCKRSFYCEVRRLDIIAVVISAGGSGNRAILRSDRGSGAQPAATG